MTRASDWVAFVLKQPMSHAPGTRFVYNSGVSQLLAAMLAQAVECTIPRFNERFLFGPLGIEQHEWRGDPQGIPTGGFGLQLSAKYMLVFGLLYLHLGNWNREEIVPSALAHQSVQPVIAVPPPERGAYGWHWWADSAPSAEDAAFARPAPTPYYYARGFGGQFIHAVLRTQIPLFPHCRNCIPPWQRGLFSHSTNPIAARTTNGARIYG